LSAPVIIISRCASPAFLPYKKNISSAAGFSLDKVEHWSNNDIEQMIIQKEINLMIQIPCPSCGKPLPVGGCSDCGEIAVCFLCGWPEKRHETGQTKVEILPGKSPVFSWPEMVAV